MIYSEDNSKHILAIDVGTTALKAVLFDIYGNVKASSTQEYELEKPAPDIVEVEVEVYWLAVKAAVREILEDSQISPEFISSAGITSQGETLIVLDKNGKALRKAIVWLDNRARHEAKEIEKKFTLDQVYHVTGQHEIAPGWPASKILWLRKNQPEIFAEADKFLMVEDYLIYRLTGKFATDHALNPSTLYYDIENYCWWQEMLDFLNIKADQLPELLYSGETAGKIVADIGLSKQTQVTVAPIDQIAGAVGAGNIAPGMITETTGSALAICATLDKLEYDPAKKAGIYLHAQKGNYVILPWEPTAGMVFRWFRDELGSGKSYRELEEKVHEIPPGSNDLTVLPGFSECGAFIGLTLAHSRTHITRAIFESIAFLLRENIELLKNTGLEVTEVCSLGGASYSPPWIQIKADALQKNIVLMECNETTCLGTAVLSAIGTGIYEDLETAKSNMIRIKKIVEPNQENAVVYNKAFEKYKYLNKKIGV
jgi:xylulokinase